MKWLKQLLCTHMFCTHNIKHIKLHIPEYPSLKTYVSCIKCGKEWRDDADV